jgi:hypothetical protein
MSSNFSLFSNSSSGKSERQLQFENLYITAGIDFLPIITDAHRKVLQEAATQSPEFVDKLFWAHGMNRNMVGFLKQRYPERVHYDEANRVYIKLGDQARVYFKKLDEKFKPRNIPTGHVIDLNSAQGQLFGRELTVLYVGPRLRRRNVWDEIDCFMVEMRNNSRCEWVSDLSDLSSSMGRGFAVVPPPTPPTVLPAINVRLKNKDLGKEADNGKTATK